MSNDGCGREKAAKGFSFGCKDTSIALAVTGKTTIMKQMLGAVSLSLLIATCVSVEPGKGEPVIPAPNSFAAADTPSSKAKKAQKTKGKAIQRNTVMRSASYYSSNPEHDVYVRGEYVGSDPDPRVRATIRREAVRHYGLD